jgi:hypothetical protein
VGEKRNVCMNLVGNPKENRPLGRSKRRRENSINMDLRETG